MDLPATDLANGFLRSQALSRWLKGAGLVALAGLVAGVALFFALTWLYPSDAALLQGRWEALQIRGQGQEVPGGGMSMHFAQDRVILTFPGMRPVGPLFRIDPSKNPKEIDISFPTERMLWTGIYRLQGDRLLLCLNSQGRDRPADFGDERCFTYDLKRAPVGP